MPLRRIISPLMRGCQDHVPQKTCCPGYPPPDRPRHDRFQDWPTLIAVKKGEFVDDDKPGDVRVAQIGIACDCTLLLLL